MRQPSRTVVSVPRPPTRSKGIYSPLQRGGDGALCLGVGGRGTEATVLLSFAMLTIVGVREDMFSLCGILLTELLHVLNRHIFNRLSSLTSVVAEGGEYP